MAYINLNGVALATESGGTVTLDSGVTGGAGLTALGTVASGNLSNTAIVYPAGHVVQTKSTQTVGQVGVGSDTWSSSRVHGVLTITPVYASSNILLWFSATTYCDSTVGYMYTDVYKNASDVTETANLSGNTGGALTDGTRAWTTMAFSFLDTCPENSLSEKTYKMSARGNGNGTAYLGWGAQSPTIITAMEIAT